MAPSTVTALAYHRIQNPGDPDLSPTVIDAYPADFEAQMRYVAAHYNVISSWDLVRALRGEYTLPRKSLIITFDDGYSAVKETALPILRQFGLPFSLFVVTHHVGAQGAVFWWDKLYRALMRTSKERIEIPGSRVLSLQTPVERRMAYQRLTYFMERADAEQVNRLLDFILKQCEVEPCSRRIVLDWDELAELSAEGVAIGAHTRHHVVLAKVPPARARAEIAGSWNDLRARLEKPLPIFCYPAGKAYAVDAGVAHMVKQAGMVGAYTMIPGLNTMGRTNPYLLHRIGMEAGEPLAKFAIKIAGAGRIYRRVKALVSPKASAESHF